MIPQKILSLLSSQSSIAALSMIFRRKDDGISCSLVPTLEKVSNEPMKASKIKSFVFTGSPLEVDADISKALEEQLMASIEQSDAVAVAQKSAADAIAQAEKAEAAAKKRTQEAKKQGKVADLKALEDLKAQIEKLEASNAEKDSEIAGLREPQMFAVEA